MNTNVHISKVIFVTNSNGTYDNDTKTAASNKFPPLRLLIRYMLLMAIGATPVNGILCSVLSC